MHSFPSYSGVELCCASILFCTTNARIFANRNDTNGNEKICRNATLPKEGTHEEMTCLTVVAVGLVLKDYNGGSCFVTSAVAL
eukprot:15367039-Ditylum_brightwellii.AAC.1